MILKNFFLFIFALFLSFNIAYSICISNLEDIEIEIYSGSSFVGNFSANNLQFESVYIKPNLFEDNLRINFIFENNDAYCIASNDNFKFFLFPGSIEENPTTLTQNLAEFKFNYNLELDGNFQAKYSILSDGNLINGYIPFSIDTEGPEITFEPQIAPVQKQGSQIDFDIIISDSKSGLNTVSVTGRSTVSYNSSKNIETISIFEILNLSKNYEITARDVLGNENKKSINVKIDSNPPFLEKRNNKYFDKVYRTNGNRNYVEFQNIIIVDEYFNENPYVFGNFETINSQKNKVSLNCIENKSGELDLLKCSSGEIEITEFDSTRNVDISFELKDFLNNEDLVLISDVEIFVDNSGPLKEVFELRNSLGVRNLINYKDNNSYVHLIFSDESIEKTNGIPIIDEKFYLIENPSNLVRFGGCRKNSDNSYKCIWDLRDSVSIYNNFLEEKVPYSVVLGDSYGNYMGYGFNVTIDNIAPNIIDYEVSINEGTNTGVVKSGDSIDFKLLIKDNNLENSGNYFVSGDFSSVSTINPFEKAMCYPIPENESLYGCDFNGIVVKNGYDKKNVSIFVSDAAGNNITQLIEVEIFKKGDEIISAYHVEDLNKFNQNNLSNGLSSNYSNLLILNPIAREDIVSSITIAWFEGKIVLDDINSPYKIINYDLNCPANFLLRNGEEKVSIKEISLYPDGPINYIGPGDEIFAVRVELEEYEIAVDLNDMNLNCNISILKRDDEFVYGLNFDNAEQIPFTMNFTFRGKLTDDLLNSRAKDLLNKIDEIDSLEGSFDDLYDIYETLNAVCTTMSTAQGLLTSVSNVVYGSQWALGLYSKLDGSSTAGTIGKGTYEPTAIFGSSFFKEGITRTMCDYVTCKVAGDLLNFNIAGTNNDDSAIMKELNDMNRWACTFSENIGGVK